LASAAELLKQRGVDLDGLRRMRLGTFERAASFFESERDKWMKVIKAADIHIE
jgi:hypothetical protein